MSSSAPPRERRFWGLSPNVFFLGVAALLMDMSGEMIQNLLPLFLANVLGVKGSIIGLVEGLAESTGIVLRTVSGWVSDRTGNRKLPTTLGYALAGAARPFLVIAQSWSAVLAIRFVDRLGKAARSAPRDALLADSVAQSERGRAFGFHRAMDTAGAMAGLLMAAGVVYLTQGNADLLQEGTFRIIAGMALVPALLAALVVAVAVHEPRRHAARQPAHASNDPPPAHTYAIAKRSYARFLGIVALFSLGNVSIVFYILRAQTLGLTVVQVLLLLAAMNALYTGVAYYAGKASDKVGRRTVLATGWAVAGAVSLGFGLAHMEWQVLALFVLYGAFLGLTDGTSRAFVADLVPSARRGSAYGLYYVAAGLPVLPAGLIAGFLWQEVNHSAPFLVGAAVALVSTALLLALVPPPDAGRAESPTRSASNKR
ncbi:MAG: MFS transporter [Dehalococcoidia bacterium]|nr:MFS transporter [Dehalococcoidia bacterium]